MGFWWGGSEFELVGEEGLDGAEVSELVVVGDKGGGCWVCWGVVECEEGWEDVRVGD